MLNHFLAPPRPPTLYLSSTQLSTIDLKWNANHDNGIPIQGLRYFVYYISDNGFKMFFSRQLMFGAVSDIDK